MAARQIAAVRTGASPAMAVRCVPTGMCPDCYTHEASLCADCHTAVGCRTGTSGHTCISLAA
jgi:hypothetical protein